MEDHTLITSAEQAHEVEEAHADVVTSSGVTSSGVTSSGVTALDAVAPRDVAYVIESPHFEPLRVARSANAWWMDRGKVEKLIEAFKHGHLVETSCFYAGISRDQWRYFNEVHPEFSPLISQIETHALYIKAMNSVAAALDLDPHLAMSFLKSRHPKFKREKERVESPVMQQTVQVAVSQNVDTAKIAEAIALFGRQLLERGHEGGRVEGGGRGVEALGAGAGD